MFDFMLLAAQAAGYATSTYARKARERYSRLGDELDRQQIQLQMQQEQLASTEQAYYSSEKLRDVMASQRALFAARGQMGGQGSNLMASQQSQRLHAADEQARQLSLSFRKHQIESYQRLMGLNRVARNSERRMKNVGQAFDVFSGNALESFLGGGSNKSTSLNNTKIGKWFGF